MYMPPPQSLDELCDGSREVRSTVKCYDEFVGGYERVRELCRGVYMLTWVYESTMYGRRRDRETGREAIQQIPMLLEVNPYFAR